MNINQHILRDQIIKSLEAYKKIAKKNPATGKLTIHATELNNKVTFIQLQEVIASIYQYPYNMQTNEFDFNTIKVSVTL